MLLATGLDELLAKELPGYIHLATQLAGNTQKLKTMRENMRDRVLKSEACDTASFARSMEKLYREIWED